MVVEEKNMGVQQLTNACSSFSSLGFVDTKTSRSILYAHFLPLFSNILVRYYFASNQEKPSLPYICRRNLEKYQATWIAGFN